MDNITKLISKDESKDEKYRRKILGKNNIDKNIHK